jgi:hypothetical protein
VVTQLQTPLGVMKCATLRASDVLELYVGLQPPPVAP